MTLSDIRIFNDWPHGRLADGPTCRCSQRAPAGTRRQAVNMHITDVKEFFLEPLYGVLCELRERGVHVLHTLTAAESVAKHTPWRRTFHTWNVQCMYVFFIAVETASCKANLTLARQGVWVYAMAHNLACQWGKNSWQCAGVCGDSACDVVAKILKCISKVSRRVTTK